LRIDSLRMGGFFQYGIEAAVPEAVAYKPELIEGNGINNLEAAGMIRSIRLWRMARVKEHNCRI
jgi:hypothetical protein